MSAAAINKKYDAKDTGFLNEICFNLPPLE
jgi:hypothetical protein